MDVLTWPMPADCSVEAEVISPTMSITRRTETTISFMVSPAWPTSCEPCSTSVTDAPIKDLISLAAFKAKMLVCNAMPSIIAMMSTMRLELLWISSMVDTTCDTTAPPRCAT